MNPTDILLVIPAFNPNDELLNLVNFLSQQNFKALIINDGSRAECNEIFEKVAKMQGVKVVNHPLNQGKGAALKTAFRYALQQNINYIITLDADGQHCTQDILAMAFAACQNPNKIVLGVRSFSKDIPLRSRFGNILTKHILRLVGGVQLSDTQTGLRGLPARFIKEAQEIESNRYQFELECLLLAKNLNIEIVELPIQTIYIDNNATSHFRPLVDSVRIYWVFVRYSLASIASFLLDITLFSMLLSITSHIILSTYIARVVSGTFNFNINKQTVFQVKYKRNAFNTISYYILLVVAIASLSGYFVNYLSHILNWNITLIKVLVDATLFILSFLVQRFFIFALH